jgi:L-lactate dehydrogenase
VRKSNVKEPKKSMPDHSQTITVVGCGKVGALIALLLLRENKSRFINVMEPASMRQGHIMELMHAQTLHPKTKLSINDEKRFASSDIIIHTAGVNQKIIGSRMEVARGNIDLATKVYNDQEFERNPLMIVVSNPVDVISYFIAQMTNIHPERIIGTGTLVDTLRMSAIIGKFFGVQGSEVRSMVIGEHGETMVPVFSGVSVRNKPLGKQYLKDERFIQEIRSETIFAARNIKRTQGATFIGIADATVYLLNCLLSPEEKIIPASIMLPFAIKERLNIQEDLFLSLPLRIKNEQWSIVLPELNEDEWSQLRVSAIYMESVLNGIQGKPFAAE